VLYYGRLSNHFDKRAKYVEFHVLWSLHHGWCDYFAVVHIIMFQQWCIQIVKVTSIWNYWHSFNVCSKLTGSQISLLHWAWNFQFAYEFSLIYFHYCKNLSSCCQILIFYVYRYILWHLMNRYSEHSSYILVSRFSCKF